jgi:hypothetical protein
MLLSEQIVRNTVHTEPAQLHSITCALCNMPLVVLSGHQCSFLWFVIAKVTSSAFNSGSPHGVGCNAAALQPAATSSWQKGHAEDSSRLLADLLMYSQVAWLLLFAYFLWDKRGGCTASEWSLKYDHTYNCVKKKKKMMMMMMMMIMRW